MLKKLLKYDLKSINIVLIVFYLLSIFFSLLTRIFLSIENSFILNIIDIVAPLHIWPITFIITEFSIDKNILVNTAKNNDKE